MATAAVSIPQPLNGDEIRIGIAERMTKDLPEGFSSLKEVIADGLRRTCSLTPGSAYGKFKADWTMTYWKDGNTARANWWVSGDLSDYGRVVPVSIGWKDYLPARDAVTISGHIGEVPPDRFRRETSQPVPKPVELKQNVEGASTFSKAMRGRPAKQRMV